MSSIYIIGSMNMDLVVNAPRFPVQGESLVGSDFSTAHGGKGANQAVAAARLGGKVKMCATVGRDAFGRELKDALTAEGMDTSAVLENSNSTGVALITVAGGDNHIVVVPGANGDMTARRALNFLEDARAGDVLLVQLETDFEAVKAAVAAAKQKGMVTIVNPAPADARAEALCGDCDYMIPNETELSAVTGTEDPEKGLPILYEKGVKTPIVTLGGQGCAYYDGKAVRFVPCPKAKAVDTTGAGDTFCGALAEGLAAGKPFEDALQRALRAASLSVTRKGAQPSIPYAKEID